MKSFDELVEEKLTPVSEAVQAFSRAHDVQEHRDRLLELEAAVREAERFVLQTKVVETKSAEQLRETVRSARRVLNFHLERLKGVPFPGPTDRAVPLRPAGKPQPPDYALVITQEEARDVLAYRRAKAKAEREGKEVWVED